MTPPTSASRTDRGFMIRYVFVAGCCALLHNGIVIGAARAGTGVLGAAAISFCLMIVIGYLLLCGVAFRTTPTRAGFSRYTLAMAGNFPLATVSLWLLAVPLHMPVAIASPLVTGLMIVINFLATRWAIGRRASTCVS